jgi:hypothetical protein
MNDLARPDGEPTIPKPLSGYAMRDTLLNGLSGPVDYTDRDAVRNVARCAKWKLITIEVTLRRTG